MVVDYKKLEIYHCAHQFVIDIYDALKGFPEHENNNLTSQLRRAATCLPLNIAEGSGAMSDRIFLNYLIFCYRSTRECEAALKLCFDLRYMPKHTHDALVAKLDIFTRRLWRYMDYLETRIGYRKRQGASYYYLQNKHSAGNTRQREQMTRLA